MAHYMKYSARIYDVYLHYVAPEDIHSYSVDEVFIDVTNYLSYGSLKLKGMLSVFNQQHAFLICPNAYCRQKVRFMI